MRRGPVCHCIKNALVAQMNGTSIANTDDAISAFIKEKTSTGKPLTEKQRIEIGIFLANQWFLTDAAHDFEYTGKSTNSVIFVKLDRSHYANQDGTMTKRRVVHITYFAYEMRARTWPLAAQPCYLDHIVVRYVVTSNYNHATGTYTAPAPDAENHRVLARYDTNNKFVKFEREDEVLGSIPMFEMPKELRGRGITATPTALERELMWYMQQL